MMPDMKIKSDLVSRILRALQNQKNEHVKP